MKKFLTFACFFIPGIFACGPTAPGGQGGAGGTGGAGGSGGGDNLPCDVAQVLKDTCQLCHAATPQYGAPMALATYADTQKPAVSDPTKKVWEVMKTRVDNNTMPQGKTLTAAQKAVLDNWFAANAPGSSEVCP